MLVRDEYLPHIHPVKAAARELREQAVAAAAVHHEMLAPVAEDKASIVPPRRERVSRSQHRQFHVVLRPFRDFRLHGRYIKIWRHRKNFMLAFLLRFILGYRETFCKEAKDAAKKISATLLPPRPSPDGQRRAAGVYGEVQPGIGQALCARGVNAMFLLPLPLLCCRLGKEEKALKYLRELMATNADTTKFFAALLTDRFPEAWCTGAAKYFQNGLTFMTK